MLNPHAPGEAGVYYFVYAPRGAACNEFTASAEAITPGFEKEAVPPFEVSGLEPSTAYAYCLVDRSEETGETTVGSSKTFTTLAAPPSVEDETSSGVNSTAATLEAQVNPNNQITSCSVEYGPTSAYGTSAPCEPGSLEGFGNQRVGLALTGLGAGATYHFRIVAENAAHEKTEGPDQTVTTVPTPHTDPVSVIAARSATFNGHLMLDPVDTQYSFEYNAGSECTGGESTSTADAGSGSGTPVSSSTPVTGLLPNTSYTVCLVSSNAFGSEQGSPVSFTTLVAPPTIEGESVRDTTGESAELSAQIDPDGGETTYHFEYGTTAAYGSSTPESSSVGSSDTGQSALAQIQGLQAATTYHYRVVATNSKSPAGGNPGPDQTFTTQPTGGELALADSRQWEMVSPPDKLGATIEISRTAGVIQASENGERITYVASAPVESGAAGNAAPNFTQVLSTRRPGEGWSSQVIATPRNKATGVIPGHPAEYDFFSTDLSRGLVEPLVATPLGSLGGEQERTLYIREPDGSYTPLATAANVTSGEKFGSGRGLEFKGASPDLRHVVFGSGVPLTAGKEAEGGGLYEWSEGKLQLVSVLPNGTAAAGAELGGTEDARNAISQDGSRVVWTGISGGFSNIYLRDTSRHETVQVSTLENGAEGCGESGNSCALGPLFQIANGDATQVFFTAEARLTLDSTAGHESPDLYMFELTGQAPLAGRLTDLTVDHAQSAGVRGGLIGVGENAASEQVTSLYFVAGGVLAGNENAGHEKAVAGAENLYMMQRDDAGWTTTFIAGLSGEDRNDWGGEVFEGQLGLRRLTARVSPDGEYLSFMSDRSLTGYDNRDASSGVPDEEMYLYRASTHSLSCASCDPTGARPQGVQQGGELSKLLVDEPDSWSGRWLAANVPGWTQYQLGNALVQPRYLANDGRLFFNSSDTLVPQATNGLENVYEYEPVGVGSCDESNATFNAKSDGCVGLISSGSSGDESAFLDASETGDDVFFLTTSQLATQDVDSAYDVYDAHVCSAGSPCPPAARVSPPPCSTADSCKAAPTPQPAIFGAPASSTFNGVGNLTSAGVGGASQKSKPLTRAQKLSRALKVCRGKPARRRASCRAQAEKKYGARKHGLARRKAQIKKSLSVGTER